MKEKKIQHRYYNIHKMDSIGISAILQSNEDLSLIVSLEFTTHLLENNYKVVVSIMNSASDICCNEDASNVNSLSRDNNGCSCHFFHHFGKKKISLISLLNKSFSIMIFVF